MISKKSQHAAQFLKGLKDSQKSLTVNPKACIMGEQTERAFSVFAGKVESIW